MKDLKEKIECQLWETHDIVWFYDLVQLYLREPKLFEHGCAVLMEQAVSVLADADADGELSPELTEYALQSIMWRYMYVETKNNNSIYGYHGI